MPDIKTRMENMLFEYETTNRTNFRYGEIKTPVMTVFKKKPTCMYTRPLPLKDVHTLTDWKNPAIPFNLMHKPQAITGTNPRNVPRPCGKSPDRGREQAQKTRPRLVMTPAVSLDDIVNPTTRAILCNDMYTSTVERASRDMVAFPSIKAPLPGHATVANPIYLPKLKAPYVSPEWRMDSTSWDNKQLRGYCDQTEEFWRRRPLSKCRACEESAIVHAHKK